MRIGIRLLFPLILFILIPALIPAESSEKQNLNRVMRVLNRLSIPYENRSLLADYGGFGSSVLVKSRSTEKELSTGAGDKTSGDKPVAGNSVGTFVFAVPLEAEFAVDTALALAEKIQSRNRYQNRKNSINIIVAFLGDEINELPVEQEGISHKGLRDLLTLADMPENWVLCYFDADQKPEELVVRHGIRGYIAPLDIVKPLPLLFKSRDIPWSFKIRYNEIFMLGLVEGPEALQIAWEKEINGFVLAGASSRSNPLEMILPFGKTFSPVDLAELFLAYTNTLDFPVLNANRHYFSFGLAGWKTFFVSEWFTAVLLLVTSGFFLILFLIYSSRYNAILIFIVLLF